MHRLLLVFLCLSAYAVSQQKNPADELPKLQHLSADQVNPQIDPCTDFYQYACSKFFAANPIPPDQAGWGVARPLLKWNETVMPQYLAHVTNMLKLTGESASQAAADAAVVLQMETALAKAAMDVVKRRDPKNINNKLTLAQLQKLAPSFDWQRYLTLIHAPAQQTFLV